VSWFLDEAATNKAQKAGGSEKALPKSWRLGSKPKLRQMHHDAVTTRIRTRIELRARPALGMVD
jgi:hypothetical protein